MHWTKIPTNLLINRLSDHELVSIIKYQLLWADLEYQPDDKTALRYLTNKQLTIAKQWQDTIKTQVTRDIRSCETNRNGVKLNYLKNKDKSKKLSLSLTNSLSSSLDEQIREDKIREDNITNDDVEITDSDLKDIKNFEEWRSQQAGYKKDYDTVIESKPQDKPIKSYAFCGHVIKLNDKDFKDWKERYSNLDLVKELSGLDDWYDQHGDKNWFIRVQKELNKRNKCNG